MKKIILLMLLAFALCSISVSAVMSYVIDFESYNEYDLVQTESTPHGNINFYMTSTNPLISLSVGQTAALTPTGDYPYAAAPNNKGTGYTNIVGWTVNTGGDPYVDDYVLSDPYGTGAGGMTLADTPDFSQTSLLEHAYTKEQSIVIDFTGLYPNLPEIVGLAEIDLDHNEKWMTLYFDINKKLIHISTLGPATDNSGDGVAYPETFTHAPGIAYLAYLIMDNLGQFYRGGAGIDELMVYKEQDEPPVGIPEFSTIGMVLAVLAIAGATLFIYKKKK